MSFRLSVLLVCVASTAAAESLAPSPKCYELSPDGKIFSKTPELLCVGSGTANVEITLRSGLPHNALQVATFRLDLKHRAKCIDCNEDEFALTNPANSVFNQLAIKFSGKRDRTMTETGTVSIGKTMFHYRRKS